ncbi:MAG: response regulator [Patescibacteria group bacterium]
MAIYAPLTPVFEDVAVVRVLVVEDDPLLRNMLSVKLSNSHCPHMFSNDGLQALDLAKQFDPQVIVLDLMLPGKDGFEVLAELKADEQVKATPVIIFSNKSGDNERSKAIELGASAYRIKAMTDLNELIAEVRRLAKSTAK